MNPPSAHENSDRPLRVLCCSSSLDGGGSERQLALLVQNLDRSRFAPELFVLYRRGVHWDKIAADVPVHVFQENAPNNRWNWPGRIHQQQIEYLRGVIIDRKIDVVYDRTYHMTLLTGGATRGLPVPRFSTVVCPPRQDLEQSEKRFRFIKKPRLARAYREATRVLTVSAGVAKEVSSYFGIPSDNIEVLYSPIDMERIDRLSREDATESSHSKAFDSKSLQISCIGRLSQEKGQETLLQAAYLVLKHRADSVHIHFAGEGPMGESWKKLAHELGIASNVTWHGYLSNPYPLLARSDLLCLPSHYEGLPNVVMEAMYLKVPVLSTDCPTGPRELLGDSEFGKLVKVADPAAMAKEIISRIDQPKVWRERAELACQRIKQRHRLDGWVCHLQDMFASAVQQQRSAKVQRRDR